MKKTLLQLHYLFSDRDFLRFTLLIILLISVGLLEIISMSAIPLYIGTITEQLFENTIYQQLPALFQKICQSTFLFSLLFIFLYFLRAIYLCGVIRLQYHIISNRKIALTGRIYRALLAAPLSILLNTSQAFLTQVLTQHTYHITFSILTGSFILIRNIFLSLLTAILILSFNFRLSSLAIFILTASCGIYMHKRNQKLKQSGETVNRCGKKAILTVTESLQAIPETKIYGLQKQFHQRMHRIIEKESRCQHLLLSANQMLWPILELLTLFSLISAMLITMHLEHKTPLELAPALTLLTVALTRLKAFYSESMLNLNKIISHLADLNQTCSLLKKLEQAAEKKQDIPATAEPFRELQLKQVCYTYQGQTIPTLNGVSFRLEQGKSIGISGPTGCGKSTLLNIILGMLPPESGQILVNQKPLTSQLTQWHRRIGYVPQNIALFDDTIEHNITLCNEEEKTDRDSLQRAVEAAQLTECIRRQPRQMQTIIGEQGRHLSGGERQRIGIARALYRQPEILVLDEATSALDTQTERALTDTIRALKGTVTIIIVAHRLSTIEHCDYRYEFSAEQQSAKP